MKNSRSRFTSKILVVVLSICMIFGMMPAAFAAGPTVTVGTVKGKPGSSVSIPITLSEPAGIATYQFYITYDASKVVYKSITSGITQPTINSNNALNGEVRVGWFSMTGEALTEAGTLFTVNFEIKEGTPEGAIEVKVSQEIFSDVEAVKIPVTVVQGKINVEDPATLEAAKAAFKAVTATVSKAIQDAQEALDNAKDVPVNEQKTAVQNAVQAVQAANKTDAEIDAFTTLAEVNAAKAALEAALDELKAKIDELEAIQKTLGDLNGDGKFTIGDLGIIAYHYGKDSNSADWNTAKKCDINQDGRIGLEDMVFIARRIIG